MARKWVRRVHETSAAKYLPPGLFERNAATIAKGLKRAVREAHKAKARQYRSAMDMLNFYINRAGKRLGPGARARLEHAKVELRRIFNRI
jgi:hypothetical protein